MKKTPLAPREQECYDIIVDYYKQTELIPSHVHVAEQMGIKTRQQVTALFDTLCDKGWLTRIPLQRYVLTIDPVDN